MQVGDLVKPIDKKSFGIVTKLLKLHGKNRTVWVYWPAEGLKQYETDYYLDVVCK